MINPGEEHPWDRTGGRGEGCVSRNDEGLSARVIPSYTPTRYREDQNPPVSLSPATRTTLPAESSVTQQAAKEQRSYFLLRIQFQVLITIIWQVSYAVVMAHMHNISP